jgi:hypothetical protein
MHSPRPQILQRLGFLHLLSRKLTEWGARPAGEFKVGDPRRREALAAGCKGAPAGWGAPQDLALLRGILEHGGPGAEGRLGRALGTLGARA